jgi:hypothetical protein
VTGPVNQELWLQNEYLAAENRNPESPPAVQTPALRSGAVDTGRDRETTRTHRTEAGGLYRHARHHPGVVSAAGRPQVRRFQTPAAILADPITSKKLRPPPAPAEVAQARKTAVT